MTHVFFPVFAEHFDDDAEIVPAHDNDEIWAKSMLPANDNVIC